MGAKLYTSSVHETVDKEVRQRYYVGPRIGRGCYGVVFEAEAIVGPDAHEEPLAIKKILNCFRNGVDAQRTYREAMYSKRFSGHENIVRLRDVLCSRDDLHLYLVMDLMDSDLQKAIRVRALQRVHRELVTYGILRALHYMHSAGIMHRDVKPANVLLSKHCEARLADFGWAREAPAPGDGVLLTDYASTRWYRAPEMLFGARYYTTAIDIWALGCITGEMYGDGPLIKGTSTLDMGIKIYELLGKPAEDDIASLDAPGAALFMEPLAPGPPNEPMECRYPDESAEMHDFVELVVQWSPEKRLTAAEALEHPFVGSHHNPDNEPAFREGEAIRLDIPDTEMVAPNFYRDQIYADAVGIEKSKRKVAAWHRRRQAAAVEVEESA